MFDRKLLYTILSIGAVFVIALTFSQLQPGGEAEEAGEAVSRIEQNQPQPAARSPEEASASYIVKEYKGQIAVFPAGSEEPQIILETQVKFLPDYDRAQIAKGIPVNSYEELSALIEDFIS